MYNLLLTADERSAIDFCGYRYAHGDELQRLLYIDSHLDPDVEWTSDEDILFFIPESVAWQIRDIGEECEFRWDCFCPELAAKMNEFCEKIV